MIRRPLAVLLFCFSSAFAQDTLKVMSWNLLNYNTTTAQARNQYYRTVLRHVSPDVLVVQEMTTAAAVDSFYAKVINLVFPGQFSKGTFIPDPRDTGNEIYYRNTKVSFIANTPIHTALRDISEFKLYVPNATDTLRVYSVHLKASTGYETNRAAEVDSLRKVTNALPTGKYFIVTGDYNIYTSTEPAYQKLLQVTANSDGHFLDAINITGTWNNGAYAPHHTQSTRTRALPDGGSTGGLDDRFDMILYSRAVSQPGRIQYLTGSLTPIGNDGNHYNDSINKMPNTAVPDSVANALYFASDHLPVSVRLLLNPGSGGNPVITATAGPNGQINPNGAITVASGGSQTFSITPNAGYHVDSVIVDGVRVDSMSSYTFTNVTNNHTIRAVFAINQYTITASSGPNGSISPNGIVPVSHGTNRTFLVIPNSGYHVDSVIVDGARVDSTTTYTFINVTAPHSIRAVFAVNHYSIAASAGPNGAIVPGGVLDVVQGGSQSFQFIPSPTYHVDSVLVDGARVDSTSGYTFVNVTANHTIRVVFAIDQYPITSSAGPHGTITPNGVVPVNHGGTQRFILTPDAGYHVDSLLVDGGAVDSLAGFTFFNVTSPHAIRAVFAINRYTINASSGAHGSIAPSGIVIVDYGENTTFTAVPDEGYSARFVVDGVPVNRNRTNAGKSALDGQPVMYTFTNVTANHSIVAEFDRDTLIITATASPFGAISPNGAVKVVYGENRTFTITPDSLCHVDSVVVDGIRVDSVARYTFVNVVSNHSIHAFFGTTVYSIAASAGTNGSITPSGIVSVPLGGSITFVMTPNVGFQMDSLVIDGVSREPVTTYQFTGVSANHSIRATFRSAVTIQGVVVAAGWNILSLPLTVADGRKALLFPSALSSAFAFDQAAGYVVRDTIRNGVGYWLKFASVHTDTIAGLMRLEDTVQVRAGWNLIGPISIPVPVNSILQQPPDIIVSPFYGYSGSYVPATDLQPGRGYWVKISQNGTLIIH